MAAIVLVLKSTPCFPILYLLSGDNDLTWTNPLGLAIGVEHLGLECDLDWRDGDLTARLHETESCTPQICSS